MLPSTRSPSREELTEVMSTSSSEQRKRKEKNRKTFKLGTFNVRGLSQDYKQEQLSHDMSRYSLDVICIQETKIKELINIDIEGNRLICLESNSQHHGNGFMVSKKWKNNIYKFWRVNDRIAVLQLQLQDENGETQRRKRMEITDDRRNYHTNRPKCTKRPSHQHHQRIRSDIGKSREERKCSTVNIPRSGTDYEQTQISHLSDTEMEISTPK